MLDYTVNIQPAYSAAFSCLFIHVFTTVTTLTSDSINLSSARKYGTKCTDFTKSGKLLIALGRTGERMARVSFLARPNSSRLFS